MSNQNIPSAIGTEPLPKKSLFNDVNLGINLEKVFILIESIFPFELCLQHQIVPLNLINDSVILGMVNTKESSVLQGLQPILKSHNYLINRKTISAEILKEILAEYLKHKKEHLSHSDKVTPPSEFTMLHAQEEKINFDLSKETSSTLIIEQTQNIIKEIKEERKQQQKQKTQFLNLTFDHINDPPESLIDLPADKILSELFAKILKIGINQISFQYQEDHGVISWHKGAKYQTIIHQITISKLKEIINELKKMLFLPVQPVNMVRKFESIRVYKNYKILMRLQLVPSEQGEQAFLYLFWGKTLKAYQEYQLNRLGKEGLVMMDELEKKITQMIQRSQFYELSEEEVPYLQRLQDKMYYQIELLSSIIYNHSDTLTGE